MNRFYVILDDVNQYFYISSLFWGCLHHKLYWLGRILSLVYFLDNIYKNGLIAICKNSSCKPNYSTKIITNKNVGLQYNYKWVMSVVFRCCTSLFIFCILFSFDNVFIVWYILKQPVILRFFAGFGGVILRNTRDWPDFLQLGSVEHCVALFSFCGWWGFSVHFPWKCTVFEKNKLKGRRNNRCTRNVWPHAN